MNDESWESTLERYSSLAAGGAGNGNPDPEAAARAVLERCQATGDPALVALSRRVLGKALYDASRYTESLSVLLPAEQLFAVLPDSDEKARFYNLLGIDLKSLGQKDGAVERYREAIRVAAACGAREVESMALNNYANLGVDLGNVPAALDAFRRAAEILDSLGKPDQAAVARSNYAEAMVKAGNWKGALAVVGQVEKSGTLPAGSAMLANLLVIKANALAGDGYAAEAAGTFEAALSSSETGNNAKTRALTLTRYAQFSLRAGNPAAAEVNAREGAVLAADRGLWPIASEAYAALAKALALRDDYKSAMEAMEAKMEVDANVRQAEAELKLASMAARFELERAERESRSLRARAADLERLVTERTGSMGRLVARIAHEVNTPLGVCVTGSSFARECVARVREAVEAGSAPGAADLANAAAALDTIYDNCTRAAGLIAEFKTLTREHEYDAAGPYRPGEVIRAALARELDGVDAVHAVVDVPDTLEATGKPRVLESTLARLVANSLSHGFPNGRTGTIRLSCSRSPGGIVVRYEDDGVGPPPAMERRMFEPFSTGMQEAGRRGLGLAIAYNAVTVEAAGTLSWYRPEGGGLGFLIKLPDLAG